MEGAAGGEDVNWNPIEWDRAAEELTWERLLGLDGSLVFLEHVFWVVSLNTMFILVFGEGGGREVNTWQVSFMFILVLGQEYRK